MNPLSGVFDEAWRMYKTFARHFLAIAFVVYLVAAIIVALLGLAGRFGFLLGLFVVLIAGFVLQATLVKAVQDVRDGRVDLSLGETISAVTPSLAAVIGAAALASLGIWIGFWFIIIPGLYLLTIWALIVPVIVIERPGALASFSRSRNLVRGHGWHVFGTLVLLFIIQIVVEVLLRIVFTALPLVLGDGLSSVIAGTLISPFLAIVVTLVYYRLVGNSAPTTAGPYGGYGGYQQPPPPDGPNYGGFGQPPPQDSPSYGGFGQPPQDAGPYGGWSQPPQEPPTQRLPRSGDWDQPS
jgi:hypothetical protein